MQNKSIGILGAGRFGTALAWLAGQKQTKVLLCSASEAKVRDINQNKRNSYIYPELVLPDCVQATNSIGELTRDSDFIILAIPAQSLREIGLLLADHTETSLRLINTAKGIESSSGLFMHEIAEEVFGPELTYATLSGPNFASEILAQVPTASVLASDSDVFIQEVQDVLACDHFRLYGSHDVTGVELGGALKNVLAIAVGIHDSLGLGHNSRAALVTRGLAEISRLGEQLNCSPKTLMGLSGVGDLYLTSTSELSRNYRFGRLIGSGLSIEEALFKISSTIEGIETAHSVLKLSERYAIDMPVAQAVCALIFSKKTPEQVIREIMHRPFKYEEK